MDKKDTGNSAPPEKSTTGSEKMSDRRARYEGMLLDVKAGSDGTPDSLPSEAFSPLTRPR